MILINIITANFRSSVFWRQIIYITSSHRSGDQANTKLRPLSFTSGAASMRATVQRCPTLRRSCWRRLVARIRKLKQKNISDHISDPPPLEIPSFSLVFVMESVPKLHLKMNQDPDCLLAGRPLTQFDLYVSTLVPLRWTSKNCKKKTLFLATWFPGQMFSRQWRAIPYFSSMRTQNWRSLGEFVETHWWRWRWFAGARRRRSWRRSDYRLSTNSRVSRRGVISPCKVCRWKSWKWQWWRRRWWQ